MVPMLGDIYIYMCIEFKIKKNVAFFLAFRTRVPSGVLCKLPNKSPSLQESTQRGEKDF